MMIFYFTRSTKKALNEATLAYIDYIIENEEFPCLDNNDCFKGIPEKDIKKRISLLVNNYSNYTVNPTKIPKTTNERVCNILLNHIDRLIDRLIEKGVMIARVSKFIHSGRPGQEIGVYNTSLG